uniref:Uncharacterized protein n=1 Tax=Ananas comosus var. bracteatus TaxID=296719 RepID=A0A6V7PI20_ANACO|nr:unnamed protein product [Ananas comosus var. bracteatus]
MLVVEVVARAWEVVDVDPEGRWSSWASWLRRWRSGERVDSLLSTSRLGCRLFRTVGCRRETLVNSVGSHPRMPFRNEVSAGWVRLGSPCEVGSVVVSDAFLYPHLDRRDGRIAVPREFSPPATLEVVYAFVRGCCCCGFRPRQGSRKLEPSFPDCQLEHLSRGSFGLFLYILGCCRCTRWSELGCRHLCSYRFVYRKNSYVYGSVGVPGKTL